MNYDCLAPTNTTLPVAVVPYAELGAQAEYRLSKAVSLKTGIAVGLTMNLSGDTVPYWMGVGGISF